MSGKTGSVDGSAMRIWVRSLALLNGLRVRHCCELCCRSQMQLGSGVEKKKDIQTKDFSFANKAAVKVFCSHVSDTCESASVAFILFFYFLVFVLFCFLGCTGSLWRFPG